MKIPEVSLITPTCHHYHINSLSPPLSFAGNFAVCNSLIRMYKRALFKMDASVFSGWGAQHQQTLLKKSPILATVNPSIKSFATSQRNLPPPICRKLKYQFPTGEVHTLILLSILNPLGFSPGEFWQCMLDFREWDFLLLLLLRWGLCASLSQLTTSSDCSFPCLLRMWHCKFWYCPHWEVWWETENYYTSLCCVALQ